MSAKLKSNRCTAVWGGRSRCMLLRGHDGRHRNLDIGELTWTNESDDHRWIPEPCRACRAFGYHREFGTHRRAVCWDCRGTGEVTEADEERLLKAHEADEEADDTEIGGFDEDD